MKFIEANKLKKHVKMYRFKIILKNLIKITKEFRIFKDVYLDHLTLKINDYIFIFILTNLLIFFNFLIFLFFN